MIYSKEKNFLFLHTRKTAGSSLKISLSQYLCDEDVMIGSWNEAMLEGVKLNKSSIDTLRNNIPQYLINRLVLKTHGEAVNNSIKSFYNKNLFVNSPHTPVTRAIDYFNIDNSCYKFCFVRNPWEQIASDYMWRLRTTGIKGISFEQYVMELSSKNKKSKILYPGLLYNWEMYTLNNRILVDDVFMYENIEEAVDTIKNKINLKDFNISKNGKRNSISDYSYLYQDKDIISLVRDMFDKEIVTFNYDFPY